MPPDSAHERVAPTARPGRRRRTVRTVVCRSIAKPVQLPAARLWRWPVLAAVLPILAVPNGAARGNSAPCWKTDVFESHVRTLKNPPNGLPSLEDLRRALRPLPEPATERGEEYDAAPLEDVFRRLFQVAADTSRADSLRDAAAYGLAEISRELVTHEVLAGCTPPGAPVERRVVERIAADARILAETLTAENPHSPVFTFFMALTTLLRVDGQAYLGGLERHLELARPDPCWYDFWYLAVSATLEFSPDPPLQTAVLERVVHARAFDTGIPDWYPGQVYRRSEQLLRAVARSMRKVLESYRSVQGGYPDDIAGAEGRPLGWVLDGLESESPVARSVLGTMETVDCLFRAWPGVRIKDYSKQKNTYRMTLEAAGCDLELTFGESGRLRFRRPHPPAAPDDAPVQG
ncbi:MAG: hypothetical protein GF355_17195 [Candidatus Eisenbacteria bacterium]|nr:hypothetical protein [Candidatus Eisenbacteria bacterium]